jgi:hypothetical protein
MKLIQDISMLTLTTSRLIQTPGAFSGIAAFPQASSTALGAAVNPGAVALGTLASLRGGSLDMALESQSMGVLSSYGVVTVLILNSALRLYTSTKFKKDGTKYDWVAPCLFNLSSGICVISGAFTGVMFQLLNLYSKTALSTGNATGYLAFKAATANFRKLGFYTFLTCLGTFTGTFMLSFYEKVEGDDRLGRNQLYFMGSLALMGIIVIKQILTYATVHIFTPALGLH